MTWLAKCFTENIGLKLLSLLFAVGLWAVLGRDPQTEVVFRVPVEFSNMPKNLEIVPELVSVQLRARGPSWAIRRAVPGDFSVRVDLSPVTEAGERTFLLKPEEIESPTSLKVVQIIPAQVRIALEQVVTKEIPIHLRFSGVLSEGRRLKDFQLRPAQVKIAGPRSHVDSITLALTDPLDLTRLSNDKTFITTAYVSDPLVRLVVSPTVEVTVKLERAGSTPPNGAEGAPH